MSAKGDARPERQSSWPSPESGPWSAFRVRSANYARLAFACFVLLHLACQAYRASTDGPIPQPGLELQPWFVSAVLLGVWLPFAVFVGRGLLNSSFRSNPSAPGQERALAVIEPLALALVLLFVAVHVAGIAWPLLSGSLADQDVRPELIASVSATYRGVPLQAVVYLGAVGAASFYAVRQTLAVLPKARPRLARGVVALGVVAYLLGSYAVIRCASGAILP